MVPGRLGKDTDCGSRNDLRRMTMIEPISTKTPAMKKSRSVVQAPSSPPFSSSGSTVETVFCDVQADGRGKRVAQGDKAIDQAAQHSGQTLIEIVVHQCEAHRRQHDCQVRAVGQQLAQDNTAVNQFLNDWSNDTDVQGQRQEEAVLMVTSRRPMPTRRSACSMAGVHRESSRLRIRMMLNR